MSDFVAYTQEQYHMLLTLGDVEAVRRSVAAKRAAAIEAGEREALYETFLDRTDVILADLAVRCIRSDMDREFSLITRGFVTGNVPSGTSVTASRVEVALAMARAERAMAI